MIIKINMSIKKLHKWGWDTVNDYILFRLSLKFMPYMNSMAALHVISHKNT